MLAMTKSATVFVNYLASQYVHSSFTNLDVWQEESGFARARRLLTSLQLERTRLSRK
jgi:hypothetical protein